MSLSQSGNIQVIIFFLSETISAAWHQQSGDGEQLPCPCQLWSTVRNRPISSLLSHAERNRPWWSVSRSRGPEQKGTISTGTGKPGPKPRRYERSDRTFMRRWMRPMSRVRVFSGDVARSSRSEAKRVWFFKCDRNCS